MKTSDRPKKEQEVHEDGQAQNKKETKRRPWVLPVVLIVGVLAVIYGVKYYLYATTHTGTDDAYITSDVIQITPQVNGTIIKVLVKENDHVKQGQVLAQIDPATYQQAVDQAQANLDLARAEESGAQTSAGLTQATGNAQIESARGVVSQSSGGVEAAKADVAKFDAGIASAKSSVAGAEANMASARSAITQAVAQAGRLRAAVAGARAQVQAAANNVSAAQSNEASAQSASTKASHDYERSQVLFSEGALAAQQNDAYKAAAEQAEAQLAAATTAVSTARANVTTAVSNLQQQQAALEAGEAAVTSARSQFVSAGASYQAANDAVRQALAQAVEAASNVTTAKGKAGQAAGQLNEAETANRQVAVSENQVSQAEAKVEQAEASLKQAKINLDYCTIKAPEDGQVTKKTIDVGTLAQTGAPIMALVPDEQMWVEANFKETQLDGVRKGQQCEVEVDAVPGHTFTGKVESISRGTGSTFALLPPDNATGNFTKVVQRVPVKITLDSNQDDLDLLRSGMSVNAVIDLK